MANNHDPLANVFPVGRRVLAGTPLPWLALPCSGASPYWLALPCGSLSLLASLPYLGASRWQALSSAGNISAGEYLPPPTGSSQQASVWPSPISM